MCGRGQQPRSVEPKAVGVLLDVEWPALLSHAGKPCGNGFPMAGLVTTQALAERFANGMEFFATFGECVVPALHVAPPAITSPAYVPARWLPKKQQHRASILAPAAGQRGTARMLTSCCLLAWWCLGACRWLHRGARLWPGSAGRDPPGAAAGECGARGGVLPALPARAAGGRHAGLHRWWGGRVVAQGPLAGWA